MWYLLSRALGRSGDRRAVSVPDSALSPARSPARSPDCCAVLFVTLCVTLCLACGDPPAPRADSAPPPPTGGVGKGDAPPSGAFPSERDLAWLIPADEALRRPLRGAAALPSAWLDAVEEALAASELGARISDESWPEDWRLVSARATVCSPLGRVADAEEIDRLCWPEVRLVWQPLVADLNVSGVVRAVYADDRALHALYFVSREHPTLAEMRAALAGGARLRQLGGDLLARFERARDEEGLRLLRALEALRGAAGPYAGLGERPELLSPALAEGFWGALEGALPALCPPEGLHELTAFSLPLGRAPAAADLWSFVAFSAEGGRLTPAPLRVWGAEDGALLFEQRLDRSEDVTSSVGDPELLGALAGAPSPLAAQVVGDVGELREKAARLNDPYQTLVPHTTCSSCHRDNNLPFNFHNLSYFEDQPLSVSPRARRDVERDLGNARALWARR
ncbi:MAG: hypothetical protein FJ138_11390 [Deltaproteobacteria bacterium]|nr:hypothetical protein [Deltaproteobacteria bacterium]